MFSIVFITRYLILFSPVQWFDKMENRKMHWRWRRWKWHWQQYILWIGQNRKTTKIKPIESSASYSRFTRSVTLLFRSRLLWSIWNVNVCGKYFFFSHKETKTSSHISYKIYSIVICTLFCSQYTYWISWNAFHMHVSRSFRLIKKLQNIERVN